MVHNQPCGVKQFDLHPCEDKEKNKIEWNGVCVCVCVCACARVYMWVYVHMCVGGEAKDLDK